MVIIVYLMIINIENTDICGFRSCHIFSPAILPRIFLDSPFSRPQAPQRVSGTSAPGVLVVLLVIMKNAYITFKRHNDNAMVIIIYYICFIENTYICGFRSFVFS